MPTEGYKSITIPEPLFEEIKDIAEKRFMTVPKFIEYLISEDKKNVCKEA